MFHIILLYFIGMLYPFVEVMYVMCPALCRSQEYKINEGIFFLAILRGLDFFFLSEWPFWDKLLTFKSFFFLGGSACFGIGMLEVLWEHSLHFVATCSAKVMVVPRHAVPMIHRG